MKTHTANDREFLQKFIRNGKVTWRAYFLAVALAGIGILFERRVPGVSRSIGAAGAAVFGTVITKHRYYRFSWFWITFIVLVVLQVPLMIVTKPMMDYFKFGFMWLLAITDLLAMGFAIELMASFFG